MFLVKPLLGGPCQHQEPAHKTKFLWKLYLELVEVCSFVYSSMKHSIPLLTISIIRGLKIIRVGGQQDSYVVEDHSRHLRIIWSTS